MHHHRAEVGDVPHGFERLLVGDPLLRAQPGELLGVGVEALGVVHGDDRGAGDVQAEFGRAPLDRVGLAEQDDVGHASLKALGRRAQDAVVIGFGEHDAHPVGSRLLHQGRREAQRRDDVGAVGHGLQKDSGVPVRQTRSAIRRGFSGAAGEEHQRRGKALQVLARVVGRVDDDRGGDRSVLLADLRCRERGGRRHLPARPRGSGDRHDDGRPQVGGGPAGAVEGAGQDGVPVEEAGHQDGVEILRVFGEALDDGVHGVFFARDVGLAGRSPGAFGVLAAAGSGQQLKEGGIVVDGAVGEGAEHSHPGVGGHERLEVGQCQGLGVAVGLGGSEVHAVCHGAKSFQPDSSRECSVVYLASMIVPHRRGLRRTGGNAFP